MQHKANEFKTAPETIQRTSCGPGAFAGTVTYISISDKLVEQLPSATAAMRQIAQGHRNRTGIKGTEPERNRKRTD
jgi:hypothetical protein